jgi:hypothetical protein
VAERHPGLAAQRLAQEKPGQTLQATALVHEAYLRLVDLPIRYAARTYGQTNIHRWRHGWLLLRMVIFAARRLKFIS